MANYNKQSSLFRRRMKTYYYDSDRSVEEINRIAKKKTSYAFLQRSAKAFFESVEAPATSPTIWRGKPSNNSLSFGKPVANDKDQAYETLKRVFDIEDDGFQDKYKQAIDGDGQEWRRITTLTSSSLLALLCFYDLNEDNPLEMKLGQREFRMTSADFEVKNQVSESHFSNIDVVLKGKDKARPQKDVHILLESKFSEYLTYGKYSGISKTVYGEIYNSLSDTLTKMGLKTVEEGADKLCLTTATGRCCHYVGGIKQMISHYLGAKYYSRRNLGVVVILAEILFDFGKDQENQLADYCQLYEKLAEGLNSLDEGEDNSVKVWDKCLTYQELLRGKQLKPRVKLYYQL